MMKPVWHRTIAFLVPLYVLIAVVALRARFPELFQHFSSAIPFGIGGQTPQVHSEFVGGDHIQVLYNGWKLKQNLLAPGASIFSDPYNFAAQSKMFYDGMVGMQYLQQALAGFLLPDLSAYNFSAFIFSTAMAMLFSHLFFRAIGGGFWQSLLLGIALGWLPYRLRQAFGGHSGGVVAYFVPMYFYAIFEFRRRSLRRYSLLAAASLLLLTVSDEHQGYYLLVASMFIFPIWLAQDAARTGWSLKNGFRFAFHWRHLLLGLILTLGWGFLLDLVFFESGERSGSLVRPFSEIRHYSHHLGTLLSTTDGVNIGNVFFYVLVFGLLPIALGVLIAGRDRRSESRRFLASDALPLSVVLFFSLFMTVGLGSHWSQQTGIYKLFYSILPYFKYQRVPIKMFTIPALCLAALVLLAFNWLSSRAAQAGRLGWSRAVQAIGLACLALQAYLMVTSPGSLLLDGLTSVSDESIQFIKKHTDREDILVLYPSPIRMDRYSTEAPLLSFRTEGRFAQGYQGIPPVYFERIRPKLERELNPMKLSPKLVDRMRKLGYSHVLVDLKQFRAVKDDPEYGLPDLAELKKRWKEVGCTDQFCLFEIPS